MKELLIDQILNNELMEEKTIDIYKRPNRDKNTEVDNLFLAIAKLSYNSRELNKENVNLLVDEYLELKSNNDSIKKYIDGLASGTVEIEIINHILITFVNQFCSKINQIDMTDRTRYNR